MKILLAIFGLALFFKEELVGKIMKVRSKKIKEAKRKQFVENWIYEREKL